MQYVSINQHLCSEHDISQVSAVPRLLHPIVEMVARENDKQLAGFFVVSSLVVCV